MQVTYEEHIASGLNSKAEDNKNIAIDLHVLHSTSTDQEVCFDVNAY